MTTRTKLLAAFFTIALAWMVFRDILMHRPRLYPAELLIVAMMLMAGNRYFETTRGVRK